MKNLFIKKNKKDLEFFLERQRKKEWEREVEGESTTSHIL